MRFFPKNNLIFWIRAAYFNNYIVILTNSCKVVHNSLIKFPVCFDKIFPFSGYLIGSSYVFLWYGSILLGFYFLYAPLFPLIFINRPLFRKLTDILYGSWESFNVVSYNQLKMKFFIGSMYISHLLRCILYT